MQIQVCMHISCLKPLTHRTMARSALRWDTHLKASFHSLQLTQMFSLFLFHLLYCPFLYLCCVVTWLYFFLEFGRKQHKALFLVHILYKSHYFLKWFHSVGETLWVSVAQGWNWKNIKHSINTANTAKFCLCLSSLLCSSLFILSHSVPVFFPCCRTLL